MGGLLTLDSFVKTFPSIDTTSAGLKGLTPEEKQTRSNVQGGQLVRRLLYMLTVRYHDGII